MPAKKTLNSNKNNSHNLSVLIVYTCLNQGGFRIKNCIKFCAKSHTAL